MGKIDIINNHQQQLLNEFMEDQYLLDKFYFSGGTALSLHYLQHRKSVDLDFFSTSKFDVQILQTKITKWQDKLKFGIKYTPLENNHTFNLTFEDGQAVKVDFAYYPYKSLNAHQNFEGIKVDSFLDIGVNKLLMVEQRAEVKDFVDLYFILQNFTIWDLIAGIKPKFNLEIDTLVLASDLLKVENFDFLPIMLKPLELDKIKEFFREEANKLGSKVLQK